MKPDKAVLAKIAAILATLPGTDPRSRDFNRCVSAIGSDAMFKDRFSHPRHKKSKADDLAAAQLVRKSAKSIIRALSKDALSLREAFPAGDSILDFAEDVVSDSDKAIARIKARKERRAPTAYAQYVEAHLARVFEQLTRKRAVIRTNAMTTTAYGPYLELVKGIFAALNISAKPAGVITTRLRRRLGKQR